MNARQRACDQAVAAGRRAKAEQFAFAFNTIHEFAEEPDDVADACVTLAVHAGIAAADVVTCKRLGVHALGDAHGDAIALLRQADAGLSRHLATLLELKSKAGYSHTAVTFAGLKKAQRAMDALLTGMRAA